MGMASTALGRRYDDHPDRQERYGSLRNPIGWGNFRLINSWSLAQGMPLDLRLRTQENPFASC